MMLVWRGWKSFLGSSAENRPLSAALVSKAESLQEEVNTSGSSMVFLYTARGASMAAGQWKFKLDAGKDRSSWNRDTWPHGRAQWQSVGQLMSSWREQNSMFGDKKQGMVFPTSMSQRGRSPCSQAANTASSQKVLCSATHLHTSEEGQSTRCSWIKQSFASVEQPFITRLPYVYGSKLFRKGHLCK